MLLNFSAPLPQNYNSNMYFCSYELPSPWPSAITAERGWRQSLLSTLSGFCSTHLYCLRGREVRVKDAEGHVSGEQGQEVQEVRPGVQECTTILGFFFGCLIVKIRMVLEA